MRFLARFGPPGLFALTVLAYSWNALKESDAYYHLATGRLIWETGSIPYADPFSFMAAGAPWVAHEWLAQLLFYGAYALGGYGLLIASVAVLGLITFGIGAVIARRPGVPLPFTLLTLLVLGYLSYELWIPRPQVFAALLAAVLVLLLERYRRAPRAWHLAVACGVMLLWANLHASFILGLVFMGWYLVSQALVRRWPALGETRLVRRDLVALAVATGAAVLLSLVNPTGYHAFLYWRYVQPTAEAFHIMEWQSILSFLGGIEARVTTALLALSAVLAAWRFGLRRESRDLTSLGMVVGVGILPFISVRHVGFWAVAGVPFAAAALGEWLRPRLARLPARALPLALVCFAALLLLGRIGTFPREQHNPYRIPVDATDFAEREGIGRMFNLYNEGGYLIWRRWPAQQVAMDGRSEVYRGEALDDFLRIVSVTTPRWDGLVYEKYAIDAFFLAYNPPQLRKTIDPLVQRLRAEGWVPVYWDDLVVIYVRDDARHADLVARHGMRVIDPFGEPEAIPRDRSREAAAEIQRVVATSPRHEMALEYARRFLLNLQ